MKVLKSGNKPRKDNKIICPECEAVLEYDADDIKFDDEDWPTVKCPECGQVIYLDDVDTVEPTFDTVEFPKSYYHTSMQNPGTVHIPTNEVDYMVNAVLKNLRENPPDSGDGNYTYASTGDTGIVGFDFPDDEEYVIYVAQDYYEVAIPYESIDYENHSM